MRIAGQVVRTSAKYAAGVDMFVEVRCRRAPAGDAPIQRYQLIAIAAPGDKDVFADEIRVD
jgi:hypothetical protein